MGNDHPQEVRFAYGSIQIELQNGNLSYTPGQTVTGIAHVNYT